MDGLPRLGCVHTGACQLSELLEVPGDRFEWEQNALIMAARRGREIVQVPIATVYLDENSGSISDRWPIRTGCSGLCLVL